MHYIDPANDNRHLLFVASVKFNHSDHHILWWRMRLNQCLIYRQRRILVEKFAGNRLTERLINKVIHRSWGENSMKIFLDLFKHIFTVSPRRLFAVRKISYRMVSLSGYLPGPHRSKP